MDYYSCGSYHPNSKSMCTFLFRKVSKIQPIRVAYAESQTANQKLGNLKFCSPISERTVIGRNPYIQKEGEKAD